MHPFLSRLLKSYFSRPRKFRYKNLRGIVLPGVFPPSFTISTKILIDFLDELALEGKTVLELGSGTGMVAIAAAKKGALVTATDVSAQAIENTIRNANLNNIQLETYESDLFHAIPIQPFDCILINPPYYPETPQHMAERAWYCGKEFEYFYHLFQQLGPYCKPESKVWMILSEDCDIPKIKSIAGDHHLLFLEHKRVIRMFETNFIFRISKKPTD